MATEIKTNQKAFLAKLDKESKAYHKRIMEGIAANADEIRHRAWRKYMIRQGALGFKKVQGFRDVPVTHKTKLLIRSGRLKRILNSPGKWSIPRTVRQARLRATSQHLLFTIVPQKNPKTWHYILNLRIMPRGDEGIKHRLNHETGRGRSSPGRGGHNSLFSLQESKNEGFKKLSLRKPRPFMAPSIQDQKFRFERVVFKKLRNSLNKKL